MSRHYGTAIEPDHEPDTREPDPTLDALVDKFYEDAMWEPTDEPPQYLEELK